MSENEAEKQLNIALKTLTWLGGNLFILLFQRDKLPRGQTIFASIRPGDKQAFPGTTETDL